MSAQPRHSLSAAPENADGPRVDDPEGKANLALVLGLVGLVLIGLISPALALVYGSAVRREASATGRVAPRAATVGVVLGWIGLALAAAVLVVFVVLA